MIKRPEQLRLLALGLPDTPLNIGGPEAKRNDNSSSSTNTTTNTTTNVTDRRMVNDGGGAGVSGDNNTTINNVTSTDLGAIAGAMDLGKTSLQLGAADMNEAVGLAGQTFDKAVTSNEDMFKINAGNMMDGFNALLDASKNVMDTAKAVNQTATQDVAAAYQSAQEMSSGSKFLVAGGLLIVGIVALQANRGKL
jgi:hypothetical protein